MRITIETIYGPCYWFLGEYLPNCVREMGIEPECITGISAEGVDAITVLKHLLPLHDAVQSACEERGITL